MIRWLEIAEQDPPLAALLALQREAAERSPESPLVHAALGKMLVRKREYAAAAAALEASAAKDCVGFTDWTALARCYLMLGRAKDVLAVASRAGDHERSPTMQALCGIALDNLGRLEEARVALTAAIGQGDPTLLAARHLLRMVARQKDGHALLDVCDALPSNVQQLALVSGHRALAFSMLGKRDAGGLVDLDTQVLRQRFEPPAEFGGIERFNRILAEEILADPEPARGRRDGLQIAYKNDLYRTPAKQALRDFTRAAIDAYLGAPETYLAGLPSPPNTGTLVGAHTVLRAAGRNGQHIHDVGYLSTIYYVSVPPLDPDSEHGALLLGCCDEYTRGHAPVWGTRRIKPEPGVLLIFPSHIFHDVVPTGSDEPRISVVADLKPSHD